MRSLAIAIVLFWLAMTFTLFRDRILPGWAARNVKVIETTELTDNWKDLEEIDRIIYRGEELGFSALSVRRDPQRRDFDVIHNLTFDIKLFGTRRTIQWRSRLFLEPDFTLNCFRAMVEVDLKSSISLAPLTWEVAGFTVPDRLYFKVTRGSDTRYGSLETQGRLSLMQTIAPTLFKHEKLRVGQVYSIPVFDPLWQMDRGNMTVRVAAKENLMIGGLEDVELFRVETKLQTQFGEMDGTFWVNDYGVVVRREFLNELLMERVFTRPELKSSYAQLKRQLLTPIPMPALNDAEFEQGAAQDSIDFASGIAELLKGNYANYDPTAESR